MPDLRKFNQLARNWEALGDSDPMFGVLSDPSKHGGKWNPDEFFASGRAHVDKLLRTLRDARATFTPGSCLDFGCGVGRLTVPLSEAFQHTIGIDVARPMIEAALRHRPAGARCDFVVNQHPDLRQFAAGSFDVVHSCLVLQHIPPDVSPLYIAEFFRVAKPGGLVVFQVPASTRTPEEASASFALPVRAFAADLQVTTALPALRPGAFATVVVRVTNRSDVTWPHDIPAGRHICLGNHWLSEDGARVVNDDARAFLPRAVESGQSVEIPIKVQAPEAAGRYRLEFDLVQEHVCWFTQHGSPTAQVPVTVDGQADAALATTADVTTDAEGAVDGSRRDDGAGSAVESSSNPLQRPRGAWLRRVLGKLRGDTPTFEMHVVPRAHVEQVIAFGNGSLIRAVDDNAAGAGWLSYTYICRKH